MAHIATSVDWPCLNNQVQFGGSPYPNILPSDSLAFTLVRVKPVATIDGGSGDPGDIVPIIARYAGCVWISSQAMTAIMLLAM